MKKKGIQIIANGIAKGNIMKKLLFLLVLLILLNSCATNSLLKDSERLFCFHGSYSQYALKLGNNNIFEAECVIKTLGVRQYYCKGQWSGVSKKIIILECDTMNAWAWDTLSEMPPLGWNPYFDGRNIKVVSKNKVILHQEKNRKSILRSDWCDCSQQYVTPMIQCDSTLTSKSKKRK